MLQCFGGLDEEMLWWPCFCQSYTFGGHTRVRCGQALPSIPLSFRTR